MTVGRGFITWWLLLAAVAGFSVRAAGGPLSRYVTDQTQSLSDAERDVIEKELSDFDAATSTQIVVVIVPTIGSESLEDASLRVAEENGIGQKGKNNGALLFVARDDRKIRIEVGYGLEGTLTDIVCGEIIRYEIAPRFREGRFFEGIEAGVTSMMKATKDEYTASRPRRPAGGFGLLPIIMIFAAVVFFSRIRRRGILGGALPMMFLSGGGFGRGSSGWGGGGGGFSGGGGSFGGGGASGGW